MNDTNTDLTHIDLSLTFSIANNGTSDLTLGNHVNITGITVPNTVQATVDVTTAFTLDVTIDTTSTILSTSSVLSAGDTTLQDHFTFKTDSVDVTATVSATIPLHQEFDLGLLTLETTSAAPLSYTGAVNLEFDNVAASGIATAAPTVTVPGGGDPVVSLHLGLDLAAADMGVPGLTSGFVGALDVSGTVLDGNWSTQVSRTSGLSLDALQNFATFDPGKVVAAFQSLDSYINHLASAQLTNVTIPFTNTTIGDVINFAQNFQTDVVDKLESSGQLLGFPHGITTTAPDGSHGVSIVVTPQDLTNDPLPANFSLNVAGTGIDGGNLLTSAAVISLTNQYNGHNIASVADLVGEINQVLAAAGGTTALGQLHSILTVKTVYSADEALTVSGQSVTVAFASGATTANNGDHVQLTLTNPAINGGSVTVTYVTKDTDDATAVAAGLASAINGNTALQAAGISATNANGTLAVVPNNGATTLTVPTSTGPDNSVEFDIAQTGNGAAPANLALAAPAASFGSLAEFAENLGAALGYADATTAVANAIADLGLQYDPTLNAIEFNLNYGASLSLGNDPTETLTAANDTVIIGGKVATGDQLSMAVGYGSGSSETVSYTTIAGDTTSTVTTALAHAINTDATLQGQGITATGVGSTLQVSNTGHTATLAGTVGTGKETLDTTVTIGGTATAGDIVDIVVQNSVLPGGSVTVTYTTRAGDTPGDVAAALAAAINGNDALKTAKITSSYDGTVAPDLINVVTPGSVVGATTLTTGASGSIAFDVGFNLGDIASLAGSGNLTIAASVGLSMTVGFSLDPLGAQANGDPLLIDGAPIGTNTVLFDLPVWPSATATAPIALVTADQIANETGLPDFEIILRDGTLGTVEVQHGAIIDHVGATTTVIQGSGSDLTSLNIGGAVAVGDHLSVTVGYGSGLTKIVTYTTTAVDNSSTAATHLAAAINADTTLQAAGVTAASAANTLHITAASGTLTLSGHATSGSETFDTQAITLGDLLTAFDDIKSANVDVTVAGKITGGDLMTLAIAGAGLANPVVVSYVVKTTDDVTQVAQGLADAVNANTTLQAAHVTATALTGATFGVTGGVSVTTNPGTATTASAGTDITVTGKAAAGDTVALKVTPSGNPAQTVSYALQSGDTTTDGVAHLVDQINQIAGVTATVSASITGATAVVLPNTGANTIDLVLGVGNTITVTTAQVGDALSLTVDGQNIAYVVKANLTSAADVAAGLVDAINHANLSGVSAAMTVAVTGATLAVPPPATETVTVAPGDGVTAIYNPTTAEIQVQDGTLLSTETPVSLGFQANQGASAAALSSAPVGAVSANAYYQAVLSATAPAGVDYTAANQFLIYLGNLPPAEVTVAAAAGRDAAGFATAIDTALTGIAIDPTMIGLSPSFTVAVPGSSQAGDTLTFAVHNVNLPNGEADVSYVVQSGDHASNIATGLVNAIKNNTTLTTAGVIATVPTGGTVVTVASTIDGTTTVNASVSGTHETLTAVTIPYSQLLTATSGTNGLVFSTTMYNVVSASSGSSASMAAAHFGVTINPVNTTLWALNSSAFTGDFAFSGTDLNGSSLPVGLLQSGPLYAETLADRFFFDNTGITANFTLTLANLDVQGTLGFIGFEAQGSGYVNLSAALMLTNPSGGTFVTFHDLENALTNDDLSSLWSFTVGAGAPGQPWADLNFSSIQLTGSGTAGSIIAELAGSLAPNPTIDISFSTPLTSISALLHATPDVTTTGLDSLKGISHLGFADIVAGLQAVLGVIDNQTGSSILTTPIPLIGLSLHDVLDYATDFANFITELQNDPATAIAQVNDIIHTALESVIGAAAQDVNLTYSSGSLFLSFQFNPSVTESLPFSLDLATLAQDVGVTLPSSVTDLVSADGSGMLSVTAGAALGVSVGFQINPAPAVGTTPLSTLNSGKGVATNGTGAADLAFLANGTQFAVNLDALATTTTVAVSGHTGFTVGGTPGEGEQLSVTLDNATLDGTKGAGSGAIVVTYTVGHGDTVTNAANALAQAINANDALGNAGITATVSGAVVTVAGATTVTSSVGANLQEVVDAINAASTGAGAHVVASINASGSIVFTDSSAAASTTPDAATDLGFTQTIAVAGANTVAVATSVGATETVTSNGTQFTVGGTVHAGDQLTVTVNGQAATPYTVSATDKLADVNAGLVQAINNLNLVGVTATAGGEAGVKVANDAVLIGGTTNAGDQVSLTVHYGGASSETVSYTVVKGDTADTIASALATKIAADTTLNGAHITAIATGSAVTLVASSGAPTLTGSVAPATSGGPTPETVTVGGSEQIAATLPAGADAKAEYQFNLSIDGNPVTVTVGANQARATPADLVAAINQALAFTSIDGGLVDPAKVGTHAVLSNLVGATLVGGQIVFAGADGSLGASPSLDIANAPPPPVGIGALGFSGPTTGTDSGGHTTLTATLPAHTDFTREYSFVLTVNGHDSTIDVPADASRTTESGFIKALNLAIGSTIVAKSDLNLGASGSVLLGQLIRATGVGTTLTLTASDSQLGSSHALAIKDVTQTGKVGLAVADLGDSGTAEALGFTSANDTIQAPGSTARVLTGTALTDSANEHQFFIDTTATGLTLNLGVSASNLSFSTNFGPLSISISNGSAILGAETALDSHGNPVSATDPNFAVSGPGSLIFGLHDGVALGEAGDSPVAGRLTFGEISASTSLFTVKIGGTETAGDSVSLTLSGNKISGSQPVSYTIASGDTAASVATHLADNINALHLTGVSARANGDTVVIDGAGKVTDTLSGTTEKVAIVSGLSNLLDVSSNFAVKVDLPVSFLGLAPVDVKIAIGNVLGGPSGWALDPTPWTLDLPNFSTLLGQLTSQFSVLNFLNSPEAVITGLDTLLGTLDTIFTQQVFGYQLPLIGPALDDAGDFIGVFRGNLIGYLDGLVADFKQSHPTEEPTTLNIIDGGINALLSKIGFTGGITGSIDNAAQQINFNLDITKDLFNGMINLSGNLGIPGLGISVSNGQIGLDLSTTIDLSFGYSIAKGFFLEPTLSGDHMLALNFAVTVPQTFSAALTLGILQVTGTNGNYAFTNAGNVTSNGTSLSGGVFVDLHPKTSNTLADLGAKTSDMATPTSFEIDGVASSNNEVVTLTLPSDFSDADAQAAFNFNVVIDGTSVSVSVAADSSRHIADLPTAINTALHTATVKQTVIDPHHGNAGTNVALDTLVTAALSGHTLTFTATDAALGMANGVTPTLALADAPLAFSGLSKSLRVEIAANLDLDIALTAAVGLGSAVQLPSVSTELIFQYQLDKVLVGTDPDAISGVIIPFTFKDVTIDLGSFLTGFLKPILDEANSLIAPLMPMLNFLTAPLPGISDIVGHSVTLLDIASLLGGDSKQVKAIVDAVQEIDDVANLVTAIENLTGSGSIKYDFGTFEFGKASIGTASVAGAHQASSDANSTFDPISGKATLAKQNVDTNGVSAVAPTHDDTANASQANAANQIQKQIGKGSFEFPFLQNPLGVLELIMGQTQNPVTLFEWNLPSITWTFSKQWSFPLASVAVASVDAVVGLGISVSIHVSIGYDTYGISEYIQTHDPVFIFDGFFVDDTKGPQLTANVSITAGAELDLTLVQVSLTGTIGGIINLELFDPNHDGKVRPSEIIGLLEANPNPLGLFEVSGSIYAELDLSVWVGAGPFTIFSEDWTIVKGTLVSFDIQPTPGTVLATTVGGVVSLNMGPLASQRLSGDISGTNGENYLITGHNNNDITIDFFGDSPHAVQTVNGATQILVNFGEDNAILSFSAAGGGITLPVTPGQPSIIITGGDGNNFIDLTGINDAVVILGNGNNIIIGTGIGDTITVGDGNNTIIDGAGNDIIMAGAGNNYIDAGGGDDKVTVGNGNNTIVGGTGKNTITAGTGNNMIIAGSASSVAGSVIDPDTSAIYTVFGVDPASHMLSNQADPADDNSQVTIIGGAGDNIILGSSKADTFKLGGSGDDIIVGDIGTITFAAGQDFATVGHTAIVSIAATGLVGGNDTIDATVTTGDIMVLGGAGNDSIAAGTGTAILLGDDGAVDGAAGGSGGQFSIVSTSIASGNDTMTGGVLADVILGGPGNDTLDGASGNDIILGDDGTVIRTAALGSAAALVSVTETQDAVAGGADAIEGGSGNDIILGGGGADSIDGGTGNDILIGDYATVTPPDGAHYDVLGIDQSASDAGNDTITAGVGQSVVMGGGGGDSLIGGAGNAVIFGDSGEVERTAALAIVNANTVDGTGLGEESLGGDDIVSITGDGSNLVFGGAGNDSLTITGAGNNVVLGDLGAVNFAGSVMTVSGYNAAGDTGTSSYAATDTITVSGNGSNVAFGGAGDDSIGASGAGANYLLGDSGVAVLNVINAVASLVSVTTVDSVTGGEEAIGGNDTIALAGASNNVAFGGAGNDIFTITGTGDNVAMGDLGTASVTGTTLTVAGHNATIGGSDTLTVGAGASGNNILMGEAGIDTLTVNGGGNNILLGDAGTATVTVGTLALGTVTTVDGSSGGEEAIGGNDLITVNGNGNNIGMGGFGQDLLTVNGTGNNVMLGDLGTASVSGAILTVAGHNASLGGNDTLLVGGSASGNNILMGEAGADTLTVNGGGNNILLGDAGTAAVTVGTLAPGTVTTVDGSVGGQETVGGNDLITVNGNGNNVAMGGFGQDLLTVNGGGNNTMMGDLGVVTGIVVDGVAGLDIIGHNTALGDGNTNYNDRITVAAGALGNNTLMGEAGADTLQVYAAGTYLNSGNNVVFGDTAEVTRAAMVAIAGPIGDTITITPSVVGAGGNAATETVIANGATNSFEIRGSATAGDRVSVTLLDTISGVTITASHTVVAGDTLQIIAQNLAAAINPQLIGSFFGLSASGWFGPLAESVDEAHGGNDSIVIGRPGNPDLTDGENVVIGGFGSDTVDVYGKGDNTILGDQGLITPPTGTHPDAFGRDTSIGDADILTLDAGADGNNVVMGEAGNDTISSVGTGLDVFYGDTAIVTHQVIGNRLYPLTIASTDPGQGGTDTILVSQGTNFIDGGSGDDTLNGGAGNDYLMGDNGTFIFGANVATAMTPIEMRTTDFAYGGNDVINTGGGAYNYAFGGTGADMLQGEGGADALAGDQAAFLWNPDGTRFEMTSLNENPTGNANDSLDGGAGNDDLIGGKGTDQLTGDAGNDIIFGDDGHIFYKNNFESMAETLNQLSESGDTISGGDGSNYLFGGGPNNNHFFANPLRDLIFNTDGHIDFTNGNDPNNPTPTVQWNMPPFIGNPITSAIGNWFNWVLYTEDGTQIGSSNLYEDVSVSIQAQYLAQLGHEETPPGAPDYVAPPPPPALLGAIEALFGLIENGSDSSDPLGGNDNSDFLSEGGDTNYASADDGAGAGAVDYALIPALPLEVADSSGDSAAILHFAQGAFTTTLDAPVASEPVTQTAAATLIFDSNTGLWVADDNNGDGPQLLLNGEMPSIELALAGAALAA